MAVGTARGNVVKANYRLCVGCGCSIRVWGARERCSPCADAVRQERERLKKMERHRQKMQERESA